MAQPAHPVDVAVVGGGIVGTATAAFLAEAGLSVRLYERTGGAAGASGRNSGIVQHPFDRVLADLYRRTLVEYRELGAMPGSAFRLPPEPSGLLYVGRDPELAHAEAARWTATWPAAHAEVLAGAALVELEAALAPDLAACRLDIGYPVEPASATHAFAARAVAAGVELVIGHSVSVVMDAGRVVGVAREGRTEAADRVVVAAGPWTSALLDPAGAWRPIRPSWGVVLSIGLDRAPRHGLESIDIDIEPDGDGGEPREDPADLVDFSLVPAVGSSALGSTFLTDEPVPGEWADRLRTLGSRYVPGIADAPSLGLRSCARPVSLDGRPLVGEVPGSGGLWIAAGNGPWGISTGPGTARLLVDAMLEASPDPIPAELAAARFGEPSGARMLGG